MLRTGVRSVKVTFRQPVADGGKRIIGYDARCRRGTGRWQEQSAHASPIRFASVTTAPVQCQVRAVNAKGRGKWRAKASG